MPITATSFFARAYALAFAAHVRLSKIPVWAFESSQER